MKLNVMKSKELAEKGSLYIKVKDCYNNMYRLFSNGLIEEDLQPAFVYIKLRFQTILDGDKKGSVYTRHAAFITKDNEVVDPTIYKTFEDKNNEYLSELSTEEDAYYLIEKFSTEEYRDFLISVYDNDKRTDGIGLLSNEKEAALEMEKMGYFIIG